MRPPAESGCAWRDSQESSEGQALQALSNPVAALHSLRRSLEARLETLSREAGDLAAQLVWQGTLLEEACPCQVAAPEEADWSPAQPLGEAAGASGRSESRC